MSSRFVAISGRVREARALCCLSAASWIAGLVLAIATCKVASELCESAFGQVPQTLNGPPVQVQPYVPEPGAPVIVINPGTANPFPIGDGTGGGGGGDGTGSGTAGDGTGGGGDGTGDGGSASGNVGNSTALATMLGTAWGATAVANAQTVGVNPSALAPKPRLAGRDSANSAMKSLILLLFCRDGRFHPRGGGERQWRIDWILRSTLSWKRG